MNNPVIRHVRLLVLILLFFSTSIAIVLTSQHTRAVKLTEQSIEYHFASIKHLDVIHTEIEQVKLFLRLSEVYEDQDDALIKQARFLINKNIDSLLEIQRLNGMDRYDVLVDALKYDFTHHLEHGGFDLHNLDNDHLIQELNAFALKVRQLIKLHEIENAELLNERHEATQTDASVVIISLLAALIIGAILIRKIFFNIHSILHEQQQTKDALFGEKERSQITLGSIGDAVITTDTNGQIDFMNAVAESLTKWPAQEAIGKHITTIFTIINEETGQPSTDLVRRVLHDGVTVGLANHTVLISRDGSKRAIEDSAAPIRDRDGNIDGIVIVFHDVTHARRMALEMSWQATHDALTGLTNRHKFEDILEDLIDSIDGDSHQHAFLYLDLDQFKIVNDTCGHVAGDELLKQVSALLKSQVRDNDTVARLGGDEFGLLLASCPIEQARGIANQMREAIKEFRFVWEDKSFMLGCSIGLVPITPTMNRISEIMRAADIACYAAKDSGRNRVHVYEPDDEHLQLREGEMEWVARINQALQQDRFLLYQQSIETLHNNANGGEHLEILIRMQGDEGNVIAPMSFIPAAERYNLMPQIDRWVIEHAFKKLTQMHKRKIGFISINISGQSLGDEHFLEFVIDQFATQNVSPEHICFEITETAAITNFPQALSFFAALKDKGCLFALDDFGSGLSSFGYLKNMPVNFLKIDGSFVRDMLQDPIDHAMVDSINSIGHTMGIETIAEFVEDQAIADELRTMGVDYGQGYGLSHPAPF